MWPRKPPTRTEKEIDEDLRDVRQKEISLREEKRNATAWRLRTALAEFFSQYPEDNPPSMQYREQRWTQIREGHGEVKTSSGQVVRIYLHLGRGSYRSGRSFNKVHLEISMDGLHEVTKSTLTLSADEIKEVSKGPAQAEAVLQANLKKLWRRTNRRYTREHQAEWAKIKY